MRRCWIAVGLVGLLVIFVFQRIDYFAFAVGAETSYTHPELTFIVNRAIRLILNDTFCVILIANYFARQDFVRIGWWLFLIELFVVLPAYLWIKLTIEGPSEISSPLLQPVHRMIVNPLLMIILMAAFYYQQWNAQRS